MNDDLQMLAIELLKDELSPTVEGTTKVFLKMADLIKYKNGKYGDAAVSPIQIFTSHIGGEYSPGTNSILVRLDDKLSRIKNSDELRFNDLCDLLGYLSLLLTSLGWTSEEAFNSLKD